MSGESKGLTMSVMFKGFILAALTPSLIVARGAGAS
jgi:hypothetical protein